MPYALVTGASTGIGREFAHLCATDGHDLVLVARTQHQLESVAAEIRAKTGRHVSVIAKDLGAVGAARELFDQVSQTGIRIDVLINNAGFGLVGKFWELDEDRQVAMVELNATALAHLSRLFLPAMIERRRGYILNVASTAAFQPGPLMAVYYATKSFVVSFSEAIYNETRDFGVVVTCLCPGPTQTEFANRSGATKTKLFNQGQAMSAAKVADIGYRGMKAGKPLVIAGTMNAVMARLTRLVPIQFAASMARKFQET